VAFVWVPTPEGVSVGQWRPSSNQMEFVSNRRVCSVNGI
jgi:hypothetical protein